MNVGLVVEHFDPRRGGLEHWSWQFVRTMIARGHELHVLARSFTDTDALPSVHCHLVPGSYSRIGYAAAVESRLAQLDLDVVHDTGAGWRCDVYQPHFGARAALIDRGIDMLPKLSRPVKRLAVRVLPRYREFAAVEARQYVNDGRLFVALSQRVADDFVKYHGVDRETIRIVQNGVDCDKYSPKNRSLHRAAMRQELGLASDTLLLMMVAHNFRLKGLNSAVRVLATMRDRGSRVHLAVLGGGSPWRYRRLARSLGVGNEVTFLGSRPDSIPALAAADVLIHPTHYDACSLVVLEALASGLPVVSTRSTGVDELMTDGVEGFLVSDPSETEAMVDRAGRLLDPGLREEMGRAARRLALKHPFSHNCDAIEAVYIEAAARRRRRPRTAWYSYRLVTGTAESGVPVGCSQGPDAGKRERRDACDFAETSIQ
jgi:UDP-glucose:(heptosyl)LPS alpha-1,3-glucosyltransferase